MISIEDEDIFHLLYDRVIVDYGCKALDSMMNVICLNCVLEFQRTKSKLGSRQKQNIKPDLIHIEDVRDQNQEYEH